MPETTDRHGSRRMVYVVSDFHAGDGSPTDAFAPRRARFERFLAQVVEADPHCQLVLAGDVFEFWHGLDGSAQRTYGDLMERLGALEPILLPGNHDVALICFGAVRLDMSLLRRAAMSLVLHRNGCRVRIFHGHQFDRSWDPRRSIKGGLVVPALLGLLELRARWRLCRARRGKPVFLPSRPPDALLRYGLNWWGRRCRQRQGDNPGKEKATGKQHTVSLETVEAYHVKHPNELIIAGHTHRAGWHKDWFVNVGAWHTDDATYVRVTPDGEVTLHEWPSRQSIGTRLWPAGAAAAPSAGEA